MSLLIKVKRLKVSTTLPANYCRKFEVFHIFTKFLMATELQVFVVTANAPFVRASLVWIIHIYWDTWLTYFVTWSISRLRTTRINLLRKESTVSDSVILEDNQFQESTRDMRTRKLSYRKDDCAMRRMYGCPENFRESLTTPTATFPEIVKGLLLRSIV